MGYATEAATACREYAFKQMHRGRVIALVRPENLPSQGVVQKLGMQLEKRTHHADYEHLVFVSEASAKSFIQFAS